MRRVLVPLDGSKEAEAIFPDARRLAGPEGELILVREASLPLLERNVFADSTMVAVEEADWYLHHEAEKLQDDGVKVRTQSFLLADAASAIDQAVRIFKADMIAIATHGRRPVERLVRGGVAWRALAHSPVPVLLRHVEQTMDVTDEKPGRRHIMVPLDGSPYSEKALPLAHELALEWNARVCLVKVVSHIPMLPGGLAPVLVVDEDGLGRAHEYLEKVAQNLNCGVHTETALGSAVEAVVHYVDRFRITDIVMASHGRTGLSRVVLGSVADQIIHRLQIPIVVIPALAAGHFEEEVLDMKAGAGAKA